jgi:hypothetical protein
MDLMCKTFFMVIKRGELRSSYQEGRVGIQLSRGESWDPVIKRGELGSSYQEGRVGIQLSRGECWDPIDQINHATFLCLFPEFQRHMSWFLFLFSELW